MWNGWWSLECGDCGIKYEQKPSSTDGRGPVICGACGSKHIRVVQHLVVINNLPTKES